MQEWPRKRQVMQKGSENAQSKWPRKRQVRQKASKVPSQNGFESTKQECLRKRPVRMAPKVRSQNSPESAKSKYLQKVTNQDGSEYTKRGIQQSKSEWPEGPETKKKMGPQLAYKILINTSTEIRIYSYLRLLYIQ